MIVLPIISRGWFETALISNNAYLSSEPTITSAPRGHGMMPMNGLPLSLSGLEAQWLPVIQPMLELQVYAMP